MIRFALSLLLVSLLTACSSSASPPAQAALDETLSMPVDSASTADAIAKAGRPSLTDDAIDTTTFPYPVVAGKKSPGGYPIYLIECNPLARECVGPTGEPVGDLESVARQLTPIRNSDVISPQYHCHYVCTDNEGNLVGAVAPHMQAWLDQRERPASATTASTASAH